MGISTEATPSVLNSKLTAICLLAQDFLWILPTIHCASGRRSVGFRPRPTRVEGG